MPAVRFPRVGYATEEGTVLRWMKRSGDPVSSGEDLLEIVSEKAINVVVAEHDGVLQAVYAPEGAVVAEGETIGWIGDPGEPAPDYVCPLRGWAEEIAPAPEDLESRLVAAEPPEAPVVEPGAPAAEAAAAQRERLRPAEATGRSTRNYVRSLLRETTGQRMARSWQAPKVDLFADVAFDRVLAHRRAVKEAGREPPSYNVYIAHAVAQAFQAFPELNINWVGGRPVLLEGIHVGVAVALDKNLVTVSMKHLEGLSLEDVQARFKGLMKKAVKLHLSREDLYGSSLTITNLGEYGITGFTPVLNPPEVFILGIGMLRERVVPRDSGFAAESYSTFCLSFDHRGVDGAPASRLLQRIRHHLEHYGEEG